MCDIDFEKIKCRGGTENKTNACADAAVRKVF